MSHLRNLFNKSTGNEPHASAASTSAVAEGVSHAPKPVIDAKAPAFPEIAVEEAHLTPENRLVYFSESRSPAADRYRLLRMRLKEHWRAGKLKKLLVTGALAHDGKTTVVLNLATALAERGKRTVLVVEADLHHPSIGPSLRLTPRLGLANASQTTILRRSRRFAALSLWVGICCRRVNLAEIRRNSFKPRRSARFCRSSRPISIGS